MQKQVEVKNISYFKNILYSVQKQGEFKIVFVKESFDMFVCREAGWGHNFLLGIPDFYLIKCGGGLGDLLTVNWINICASTQDLKFHSTLESAEIQQIWIEHEFYNLQFLISAKSSLEAFISTDCGPASIWAL